VGNESKQQPAAKPRRVNHYMKRAVVEHRYETDGSPLVPTPQKPERLDVEMVDAKTASVQSSDEATSYTADERKPLKFKGTIVVSDMPDEEPAESPTEQVVPKAIEPTEPSAVNEMEVAEEDEDEYEAAAEPVAMRKASSQKILSFREKLAAADTEEELDESHAPTDVAKARTVPINSSHKQTAKTPSSPRQSPARPAQSPSGVIGMTRASQSAASHEATTAAPVAQPAQPDDEVVVIEASPIPMAVHVALIAVALVCMVGVLGIEQQIVTEGNTINRQVSFSFERIFSQIGQLHSALFAHVLGSS